MIQYGPMFHLNLAVSNSDLYFQFPVTEGYLMNEQDYFGQ